MRVLTMAVAALLCSLAIAEAQTAAPAGCGTASAAPATSATPAATGSRDPAAGTSPGGAGSSGFTGGLGGAFVGTTQSGPDKASPSAQPVTAKGLDPIAGMPNAAKC